MSIGARQSVWHRHFSVLWGFMIFTVLTLLQQGAWGFLAPPRTTLKDSCAIRAGKSLVMMSAEGMGKVAVVVGYEDGTAQLIAAKMATTLEGVRVRAILETGTSDPVPAMLLPPNVQVTRKSLDSIGSDDLAGASVALVSLDKGPKEEAGADPSNYLPLPTILSNIGPLTKVVIAAYANDTAAAGRVGGGLNLNIFARGVDPKEVVEAARSSGPGSAVIVLAQHGRLFGPPALATSPNAAVQVLPFVGGPLQKPVLEESFAKQNILLALGSSLSRNRDAATMRSALAESMIRASGLIDSIGDFSVVSLEGQAPSAGDWEQLMAGLDTRGGVTVFEKVLAASERVDLNVLQEWLVNDFGAGLSTLAISRVLNSPKPSIVINTAVGSDIVWQFVGKDLKVQGSGRWSIQLDSEARTIKILRENAEGKMLTEALPGEEELLQRFSAAINRLVYSRKLSKRR